MAIPFANDLREASIEGRLRAVWLHPANELAGEKRATARAAIARALGLMPGSPDFLFLWADGCAALEAKSATGSASPSQKDFRAWCELHGVPYHIFRTGDEGLAILHGLGILDMGDGSR